MIALPLFAALLSLVFTAIIVRDANRVPRPDKISWAIAFAIFTIAAGAEVVGDLAGWSVPLARIYYLTGAVLVTLFLGLGQLYLLFGRRIARFAPGLTLAVVALASSLVISAPIDESRLDADHWRAIDRSAFLIAVVAISNAFGVVALIGGSLYSAWQFRRAGTHRHRMIGCLLIAAGTLVIAAKGYLVRLGVQVDDAGFYLLLSVGASVIFVGFLETRRPDRLAAVDLDPADIPLDLSVAAVGVPAASVAAPSVPAPALTSAVSSITPELESETADQLDPGVAFIESRFLPLDDGGLDRLATDWSAPRVATDRLTQSQARRVWALRCRLTPAGQAAFDHHSLPAVLQLAELYDGVFAVAQPGAPSTPPPSLPEPLTLVGGQR